MYRRQIETILGLDSATKHITHGVYAMDRLPLQPPVDTATTTAGAYVINTDDHDMPGSHWVAVYTEQQQRSARQQYHYNAMDDDDDDDYVLQHQPESIAIDYMDSYGRPPMDKRLLKFLGSNYDYNSVALQLPLSNACGFYCLYFLLHRARGHCATSIIETLAGVDSDFVVKEYLYSRYKPIFIWNKLESSSRRSSPALVALALARLARATY